MDLDAAILIARQHKEHDKLVAAKQYLADRGIAAMGPNSTFIYTDSKGKTHERQEEAELLRARRHSDDRTDARSEDRAPADGRTGADA